MPLGEGQALAPDVAAGLAPRIGFDPRDVQVHDDAATGRAAQDLGALAFTWGNHVGFAPGAFQPHTGKGQALLAHELTHVGQQLSGSTAPEHVQEAEADAVQRGGTLTPSPTGPPRPVLRLAAGDALSLTVVVGPDGRAAFSAEVEGGGIATGTGTTTHLEPGEYRVRWDTGRSDMVITNTDGSVVPETTRFDIAAVAAYDPLVRALQGATDASVPLYVRPGPAGGRPGSSAAQRQQIAALPERLRQFLFREGGQPTDPSEYAALLRIAASVADLTEDELAEFRARAVGSTSDIAVFEASVQRWLTEVRARHGAEHEQQEAKDALSGFDTIYEAYRSFALAVDTVPMFPAALVESWEAQPASALPESHEGASLDLYLRLRRALAARGIANVSAFATSITRFVTAFREHAFYIALDLLGRYEATLLEQQRRYQASHGASGLHTEVEPARTSFRQAEEHAAAARATYSTWSPEDVMGFHEAGAEYQRLRGEGRQQVRDLSVSHPLLGNQDFPVDELASTTSEFEVSLLVGRYIEQRLGNVRDTRDRLTADHELIFRMDVLVNNAKSRQNIAADSIWDKIIRDHTAPSLGDIERDMMILTLTVALGILTAGTGSLALAAISLGVGTYQAVEAYQQYAFEHDAAGARLLSEEPSLAWVVLAVIGAGVDLAGVSALIRPLRPALRAFQRSGDLVALGRALDGVSPAVRESILARASLLRSLTSARSGLRSGAMRFRRISEFWPSGQITDGMAVGRVRGLFTTTGTLVDFKGLRTLGGGRVWVSQANITLDHVDDIVSDLVAAGRLSEGRTVHVVSGRHGPGDFLAAEQGFYIQDLVHVHPGNPNVIIHDWAELTEAQLRPLLEGADDVVLAWCVSDETRSVANILVGNFW